MKRTGAFPPHRPLIEPLEQRIAPALLVTGANLLGAGNPMSAQTSIGGNAVTLVSVQSGDAIVWYDHGAITAVSVGPNTSLTIYGDAGAIVGNLTASGKLTDSDGNAANGLDGDVLLPNNILGITTHPLGTELGTIGNIITGGSVSNLNISGNLSGVYAGTGAFYTGNSNPLLDSRVLSAGSVTVNTSVDVNPILPGVQGGFSFPAANASSVESGASITNVKIGAADALQMFAGNGFAGSVGSPGHPGTAGQPGGSISNVTIESAFVDLTVAPTGSPSYFMLAGSGGSGARGGAGGSIQKINEISSEGLVDILAGQGGNGASGSGGAGGSIKSLNMQSDSSAYTVHAGKGGIGAPGGAGGSVKGINFGGDQLSNGIVVAAPFTGGSADDILLVDSSTGTMVIEQNDGNGTGFTPVIQDPYVSLTTIAPEGTTPVAAVAVDVNGKGLPDIVVAYKNSDSLGVFINQGGGIFYSYNVTDNVYSGDTLDATSVPLPYAPLLLAAGNFTGDGSQDLAVLLNNSGQTELITLTGAGNGSFAVPTTMIPLPASPVSLIPAYIQGTAYSDLFAGFKTGQIDALLSTGSASGLPFTVADAGVVDGGIANLDYNTQEGLLLALNGVSSALNLYTADNAGVLTEVFSIPVSQQAGTALVAHFVPETQSVAEPIEVLSTVSTGSALYVYSQTGDTFTFALTSTTQASEVLKNFTPVIEGLTSGVAAVGNSVEHFAFSQAGGSFYDVQLPFSGKTVSIEAGDGGNGLNSGTAAGGAGGAVSGFSILAGQITIHGGNGGTSDDAAAGAGGSVTDTPSIVTFTGQSVQTIIEADSLLTVAGGDGGTASGAAHGATGGAGGAVQDLNMSLVGGTITVLSGNGGNGSGGAGGNAGGVTSLKSVNYGGDLDVVTGTGGDAEGASGNGGAGGTILNVTHALTLTDQTIELGYNVSLVASRGGDSASGTGGAGGSVENVKLTLQTPNESVTNPNGNPSTEHADVDSTLQVIITAGMGGEGATGGAGGAIKEITSTSVFDQIVTIVGEDSADITTFPEMNPVAAMLTSGNGGAGAKGAGGAGGTISNLNLVGITHYDLDGGEAGQSPLVIVSGSGGQGSTVGGAGGAITNITSINAQFIISGSSSGSSSSSSGTSSASGNLNFSETELSGATITSGSGGAGGAGNGGAGGAITNLSIGVSGFYQDGALTVSGDNILSGGQMTIRSGGGGAGGTSGKGGAAGAISSSVLGCEDACDTCGILLEGGVGGTGTTGGGVGGSITDIQLNAPQNAKPGSSNLTYDVLSTLILAGDGGGATGSSAAGGMGGSISQIVETKDVNSAINLLQAGDGGNATGPGGQGGSVSSVHTVGLIGQASDDYGNSFGVFETNAAASVKALFAYGQVPEGIFAGAGGTGSSAGAPGSVTTISAAQIAAIGAAMDSTGLFAAAAKVANVTAEVIGYDANGNGTYNNQANNDAAPGVAVPIDGFVYSETALSGVDTLSSALLEKFTFIA